MDNCNPDPKELEQDALRRKALGKDDNSPRVVLVGMPHPSSPIDIAKAEKTEVLDSLERTLFALKTRNMNKPHRNLDEVILEAEILLKKNGRDIRDFT